MKLRKKYEKSEFVGVEVLATSLDKFIVIFTIRDLDNNKELKNSIVLDYREDIVGVCGKLRAIINSMDRTAEKIEEKK